MKKLFLCCILLILGCSAPEPKTGLADFYHIDDDRFAIQVHYDGNSAWYIITDIENNREYLAKYNIGIIELKRKEND